MAHLGIPLDFPVRPNVSRPASQTLPTECTSLRMVRQRRFPREQRFIHIECVFAIGILKVG